VSEDGKAMKFYEVTPFAVHLTPEMIMTAVQLDFLRQQNESLQKILKEVE
jgi:hypothetical protein